VFSRSIIEDILPAGTATEVAHYTRIGTLCHFIPPDAPSPPGWTSAWATPVQFLNDRRELSLGLEVLRNAADRLPAAERRIGTLIENLLTTFGRLETDAFQMSFSGNPDELGQWRGYAANGMGCAIVTDAMAVKSVADVAGWVIYDTDQQQAFADEVLGRLRNETNNDRIEQVLVAAASYMKHEGFRPEEEYRLLKFPRRADVKFRESGDRLVPYVDYLRGATPLPIKRVIIGPGWQLANLTSGEMARNHIVQGIQRLLTARGLHATGIISSSIPYDPK
jgi:hypothetical protein